MNTGNVGRFILGLIQGYQFKYKERTMAFKSEKAPEKVRRYMTRNLPDRLHYRMRQYAARKRIALEVAFNLAVERGIVELEREEGE